MQHHQKTAEQQQHLWRGVGGHGWTRTQALSDRMYQAQADILTQAAAAARARRVLDVGCGTGATTVAAARQLAPDGHCFGIDLSQAMIDAATERAKAANAPARFVCADAQTHAFGRSTFDMIISRFGIMFFDDPVRAFSNLRDAAADDAHFIGIAWRSPEDNPFMTTAEQAAEPYLPGISQRIPDEPGQFGFADPERVAAILRYSGWRDLDISALDQPCAFPATALDLYLSQLGPVGRALQQSDPAFSRDVISAIKPAFDRYITHGEVRFTTACWLIRARSGR